VGCIEFGWVVGSVGFWVQSFHSAMGWVGSVVWWVGLKKLDAQQRTTLSQLQHNHGASALLGIKSFKMYYS